MIVQQYSNSIDAARLSWHRVAVAFRGVASPREQLLGNLAWSLQGEGPRHWLRNTQARIGRNAYFVAFHGWSTLNQSLFDRARMDSKQDSFSQPSQWNSFLWHQRFMHIFSFCQYFRKIFAQTLFSCILMKGIAASLFLCERLLRKETVKAITQIMAHRTQKLDFEGVLVIPWTWQVCILPCSNHSESEQDNSENLGQAFSHPTYAHARNNMLHDAIYHTAMSTRNFSPAACASWIWCVTCTTVTMQGDGRKRGGRQQILIVHVPVSSPEIFYFMNAFTALVYLCDAYLQRQRLHVMMPRVHASFVYICLYTCMFIECVVACAIALHFCLRVCCVCIHVRTCILGQVVRIDMHCMCVCVHEDRLFTRSCIHISHPTHTHIHLSRIMCCLYTTTREYVLDGCFWFIYIHIHRRAHQTRNCENRVILPGSISGSKSRVSIPGPIAGSTPGSYCRVKLPGPIAGSYSRVLLPGQNPGSYCRVKSRVLLPGQKSLFPGNVPGSSRRAGLYTVLRAVFPDL